MMCPQVQKSMCGLLSAPRALVHMFYSGTNQIGEAGSHGAVVTAVCLPSDSLACFLLPSRVFVRTGHV